MVLWMVLISEMVTDEGDVLWQKYMHIIWHAIKLQCLLKLVGEQIVIKAQPSSEIFYKCNLLLKSVVIIVFEFKPQSKWN